MSESQKQVRGSISGAWVKEGRNGKFFTGSFTRESLLKELDKFPGIDKFQLYVSPITEKSKENSPDLSISFTEWVSRKQS